MGLPAASPMLSDLRAPPKEHFGSFPIWHQETSTCPRKHKGFWMRNTWSLAMKFCRDVKKNESSRMEQAI